MKSQIILALASAAIAPITASAQSSIQMYGRLDASIASMKLSGVGSKPSSRFNGVLSDTSNIGFRGTEDLGDGRYSFFKLEHGLELDTGADSNATKYFNRESYVGIGARQLGQVQLGSQYSPDVWLSGKIDPFGRQGLGTITSILQGTPRGFVQSSDNSVQYVSPVWEGFQARAVRSLKEDGVTKVSGISLDHQGNKYYLGATYDQFKADGNSLGLPAVGVTTGKVYTIAGILDMNFVKLHGWLQSNRISGLPNATGAMIGVTVPIGSAEIRASTIRRNLAGQNSGSTTVGYYYFLSKRTSIYGNYAKLSNDSAAAFVFSPARASLRPAIAAGEDVRGLQIGLRHVF